MCWPVHRRRRRARWRDDLDCDGREITLKNKATLTRPMSTGTSTRGPITAANAAPWWMPNVATDTAMASSKCWRTR